MSQVYTLVLFIYGSAYAVRVKNLPILPVGSSITLNLGEYTFEDLKIGGYYAYSNHGITIDMEIDEENMPEITPTIEQLQKIFKKDASGLCEYEYPETIDFSGYRPG